LFKLDGTEEGQEGMPDREVSQTCNQSIISGNVNLFDQVSVFITIRLQKGSIKTMQV